MSQLRPISLCNTLYKVVSKILVARLRPLMSKLVSPTQVSFVPGRHITDNIVVDQEMLHKFKVSKGKNEFVAWKIDLSKAYDRLSLNFIRDVLWEVVIRGRILELLMSCISSVQYKAVLNGELTEAFVPKCGIRQGDPLSPYIFVMCMEKLSHLIHQSVQDKIWKPVQICQGGPMVSHLFFANDLILFGKASVTQAKVMKQCLDDFCNLSSQRFSFEKFVICVSPNTCSDLARQVASISGSPLTDCLGKYLGVPLIHKRVTKATYFEIVDKVQRRLSAWKSHTLSMACRITLTQSVPLPFLIYAMQTAQFSASVCDKLDQLNRNFLWGHTVDKSKVHLVNWDTVCQPKTAGGLGIKRTTQNDQGLWSQVLNAKYLRHYDLLAAKDLHLSCSSSVWRGVLYGAKLLPHGL
ncbi:unnamed protein product [Prunus brigantina]